MSQSSFHSSQGDRDIYLVLDWDGTITRHDTMRVLTEIGYQKQQTLLSQDQNLGIIPPWNYFVEAYLKDYNAHVANYHPAKENRKTAAEESAWLASLRGIEKASVERVSKAGIFKGLTKEDIEKASEDAIRSHQVELRPGWSDLLLTLRDGADSDIETWISSVNWSGTFIQACINAALDLENHDNYLRSLRYQLWSNDPEGLQDSSSPRIATGIIQSGPKCPLPGIHTSADKVQLLKKLRFTGGGAIQASPSDTHRRSLIIYVGDTTTDFDSLVEADIGICIQDEPLSGGQKELRETLTRLGFQFYKASDLDKVGMQLESAEKKRGIIWTAKDLHEVSAFVSEIISQNRQHQQPEPSRFPTTYAKHFIPLESDPEIFTELAHLLGLSKEYSFHDVLSLESPELLAMVPRPVHALILVFPTSEAYEKRKEEGESVRDDYDGSGSDEPVIWFRQTINNACGLYGLLHAVCNGPAAELIGTSTHSFRSKKYRAYNIDRLGHTSRDLSG